MTRRGVWDEENPDQASPGDMVDGLISLFGGKPDEEEGEADTEPAPPGVIETRQLSDGSFSAETPRPQSMRNVVERNAQIIAVAKLLVAAGDQQNPDEFDRRYRQLSSLVKGK